MSSLPLAEVLQALLREWSRELQCLGMQEKIGRKLRSSRIGRRGPTVRIWGHDKPGEVIETSYEFIYEVVQEMGRG